MTLPRHFTDDGRGVAVIFLHAFPLHAGMWRTQREGIPGVRAVTFDVPGFGKAGGPVGPASMDSTAGMALALADHLGIGRFVAAGCSMGGYVAMALMRLAPERLAGVLLANTRAGADTEEGRRNRLAQAAEVLREGSGSLIEGMLPKLVSGVTAARETALMLEIRGMMEEARPEGIASMLAAMADRPDSTETLRNATMPLCIVTGEDDRLIPPAESERMAALRPGTPLHVLRDCGHLTCLEDPTAFNRILRDFAAGLRQEE